MGKDNTGTQHNLKMYSKAKPKGSLLQCYAAYKLV